MSRFFRGGSDSESESESEYSSEEEKPTKTSDLSESEGEESEEEESGSGSEGEGEGARAALSGASRFKKGGPAPPSSDESEDEDDVKRVVKSARDKQFDEMRATVKVLTNAKKINDWVAIQNEFTKLNTLYGKATAIIQREGGKPPRFYIRALTQLEDHLKETNANKEATKKMNKSSSSALTVMKQKLKKHNKTFEKEIEAFRADPVGEDDSETERVAAARKAAAEAESDDDEPRSKWTKGGDSDDDSDVEPRKGGKRKGSKKKPVEEGDEAAAGEDGFTLIGKGGKAFEATPETLFKKLRELLEARGKKSTDKVTQLANLRKLLEVAGNPFQKVKVLLVLIPSRFDFTPTTTGFMSVETWRSTLTEINELFTLLEENAHLSISDFTDEEVDDNAEEVKANAGTPVQIRGNLGSFVDRIDDEFTKSLQNIDPHTLDYINRLKDESGLYAIIVRAQKYFERIGNQEYVDLTKMRRVERLYYKPDIVVQTVESHVRTLYPTLTEVLEDPTELVADLCTSLYRTSIDRVRTRALLCHVYHLALHDRFHEARELILMSHLQEHAPQTDIQTQILFNRTMVQLGMCAFRCGMVREAANALQEISSSGKVKELLAQGVQTQRYSDKTPEQEKLEKQRQLPFHMHINLELLECVYLTCSMLLEIPNMAANAHDARRKVISKPFRRMLDYNERQVFTGPPENTRDHIMGAAKALAAGEWQSCRDLIHKIKIWDLMPNSTQIKDMLTQKIQEEGLRTYFFTYSPYYDSLGLEQLSSMFELPIPVVYATVSKMIINEELHASLDQPTNTVILHRPGPGVEMSRLEYLAGVYSEKVATFVENNEKLLESRSLHLGLQQQQSQQGYHGKGDRQGGDRQGFRGGDRGGQGGQGGFRGGRGGGRTQGGRGGFGGGDRNARRQGGQNQRR
ncbi:Translation initiation factor 3 subunit c [Rhizophlyctis rosea]|nr:Translation initiation factor 3 subunit c [Rhizophlyctis rosea]